MWRRGGIHFDQFTRSQSILKYTKCDIPTTITSDSESYRTGSTIHIPAKKGVIKIKQNSKALMIVAFICVHHFCVLQSLVLHVFSYAIKCRIMWVGRGSECCCQSLGPSRRFTPICLHHTFSFDHDCFMPRM